MYKSNRLNRVQTLLQLCLTFGYLSLAGGIAPRLMHAASSPGSFSGIAALNHTRQAVSFGERPAGSDSIVRLRQWIVSQLKPLRCEIIFDSFTAQTPAGPVPMVNVVAKFPGTSGKDSAVTKDVVVTGHYDTVRIPMVHFVGANDAGSSTGFLIELARVVSGMKHADDIYVVFFDGEEAVVHWTATDSVYGSRHLAAKWAADGTLARVKALINIDMIGDKDLDIANDASSSQSLRSMVWQIAAKLGDAKYFRHDEGAIEDDHKPFVDAGVNAIDIIDLDYGPSNSYWHTAADTMDKLSAHSLQVVGDVVVELVKELANS